MANIQDTYADVTNTTGRLKRQEIERRARTAPPPPPENEPPTYPPGRAGQYLALIDRYQQDIARREEWINNPSTYLRDKGQPLRRSTRHKLQDQINRYRDRISRLKDRLAGVPAWQDRERTINALRAKKGQPPVSLSPKTETAQKPVYKVQNAAGRTIISDNPSYILATTGIDVHKATPGTVILREKKTGNIYYARRENINGQEQLVGIGEKTPTNTTPVNITTTKTQPRPNPEQLLNKTIKQVTTTKKQTPIANIQLSSHSETPRNKATNPTFTTTTELTTKKYDGIISAPQKKVGFTKYINPGPTELALRHAGDQFQQGIYDIGRAAYEQPLEFLGGAAATGILAATGIGAPVAVAAVFGGQNVLELATGQETTLSQIATQPLPRTAGQLAPIIAAGEGIKMGQEIFFPQEVETAGVKAIRAERKKGWVDRKPRNTKTNRYSNKPTQYYQKRPEPIAFLKQGKDIQIFKEELKQIPVAKTGQLPPDTSITKYVRTTPDNVAGLKISSYGDKIIREIKLKRYGEGKQSPPKKRPPTGSQALTDIRRSAKIFQDQPIVVEIKKSYYPQSKPSTVPKSKEIPHPTTTNQEVIEQPLTKQETTKNNLKTVKKNPSQRQRTTTTNTQYQLLNKPKQKYYLIEEETTPPPQQNPLTPKGGFRPGMKEKLYASLKEKKEAYARTLPLNQPPELSPYKTWYSYKFTTGTAAYPITLLGTTTQQKTIITPTTDQYQIQDVTTIQATTTKPTQKTKQDTTTDQYQIQDVTTIQATTTKPTQKTKQKTEEEQKPRRETPTRIPINITKPLPPPIKPLQKTRPEEEKTIAFPHRNTAAKKRPSRTYTAEVKRRGLFQPVGTFKTAEKASRIAAQITNRSAAAAFRITTNGRTTKPTRLGALERLFTTSKSNKGSYVEKKRYRINTPGEKAAITRRGLLALKKKKKLFG